MKSLMCLIVSSMLLPGTVLAANGAPNGKAGQKQSKHQHGHDDGAAVAARVHFSSGEVRVIREYYAPRYRSLPPGLQKKLQRGGKLPPGWQKKLEPIPVVVERELIVLPPGYRRGVIDGYAVVYEPRRQVIVDVAVLF